MNICILLNRWRRKKIMTVRRGKCYTRIILVINISQKKIETVCMFEYHYTMLCILNYCFKHLWSWTSRLIFFNPRSILPTYTHATEINLKHTLSSSRMVSKNHIVRPCDDIELNENYLYSMSYGELKTLSRTKVLD